MSEFAREHASGIAEMASLLGRLLFASGTDGGYSTYRPPTNILC
jgi:hypothetical protein